MKTTNDEQEIARNMHSGIELRIRRGDSRASTLDWLWFHGFTRNEAKQVYEEVAAFIGSGRNLIK